MVRSASQKYLKSLPLDQLSARADRLQKEFEWVDILMRKSTGYQGLNRRQVRIEKEIDKTNLVWSQKHTEASHITKSKKQKTRSISRSKK